MSEVKSGSFKTPGGKLVSVEFKVDSGRIRDVTVHGDFFLHPEEALEAISGSLEGVSAELSEDDLTLRIAGAIPDKTEWLGSSPTALAMAVRRALSADEDLQQPAGGGERGWS